MPIMVPDLDAGPPTEQGALMLQRCRSMPFAVAPLKNIGWRYLKILGGADGGMTLAPLGGIGWGV